LQTFISGRALVARKSRHAFDSAERNA